MALWQDIILMLKTGLIHWPPPHSYDYYSPPNCAIFDSFGQTYFLSSPGLPILNIVWPLTNLFKYGQPHSGENLEYIFFLKFNFYISEFVVLI